jgi:outer membrane protein TolC
VEYRVERQLFDAELELTRVETNELLNLVQLYKALGGGWQPDQPMAGAATRVSVQRPHEQGAMGTNTGK